MKKNVLIITRDFAPYCSVVGWMIRCVSLAGFLADSGYDVYVLAVKREKSFPLLYLNEKIKGEYLDVFLEKSNIPKENYTNLSGFRNWFRNIFQKHIAQKYLIDTLHPYAGKIARKAEEIVRNNNVENVIVSSPPHSLQLAVLNLRRKFPDLNIIAELRDPWVSRREHAGKNSRFSQEIAEYEKKVLHAADSAVVVTAGMKKYFDTVGGAEVHVIENGFVKYDRAGEVPDDDFSVAAAEEQAQGRIVIGYFGTAVLGGGSQGGKRLDGLFSFLENNREIADRVAFFFQGNIKSSGSEKYKNVKYRIFDPVDNAACRRHIRLCDICMFIYTDPIDADMVMGGKIYDYVGAGVPLLMFAPSSAECLKDFAAKNGKPLFADIYDEESLKAVFGKVTYEHGSGALGYRAFTAEEAAEYGREKIYEKYFGLLR
jgi:hypothetical protein